MVQSYFIERFKSERKTLINNLKFLNGVKSDQYILQREKNFNHWFIWKSTVFYMWMCRVAQQEIWRWPVLSHEPRRWTNGVSRLIATGITKKNPWKDLNILHFCKNDPDSTYLHVQIEIESDEMLHKIFSIPFDETQSIQESLANWGIEVTSNNTINMTYINNNTFHEDVTIDTMKIWDSYSEWRTQYPTKPKIKIYTNWPEQIHNHFDAWDVSEVVSSQHMIDEIQGFGGRTGRLERWATEEHKNPKETVDHVLYVIDPRPMELGDLLVWMDMEHSTYIESTWKFLLYRKAAVYKNTYIDTSYIMQ